MEESGGVPGTGRARRTRRARGRPSPWLFLTQAVLFAGLALVGWLTGGSHLLSLAWTVGALGQVVATIHAWRHAADPVVPGRAATSRWGAGRPGERWR